MKHYCTLSPSRQNELSEVTKYVLGHQNKYPLMSSFINNQSSFVRDKFPHLVECVIREKRLLDFETPNRAHITYEYNVKNFSSNEQIFYLFTPAVRLNWLKIFINGKAVSIADSQTIRLNFKKIFKIELEKLSSQFPQKDVFESFWKELKPIPCFILADEAMKGNFLIEIDFYQSITLIYKNKVGLLNWIDKRYVKYSYCPITEKSAWLYVKAPQKSDIRIHYKDSRICQIYAEEQEDNQIVAYTIQDGVQNQEYQFYIEIDVTSPLKSWFNVLSSIIFLLEIFYVYNFFCYQKEVNTLLSVITMPIIAMIIATRGWLVNEDSTMRRFSKFLAFSTIILVVFFMMVLLRCNYGSLSVFFTDFMNGVKSLCDSIGLNVNWY